MTLAISDLSQKQFEAEEYEWEENKLRQWQDSSASILGRTARNEEEEKDGWGKAVESQLRLWSICMTELGEFLQSKKSDWWFINIAYDIYFIHWSEIENKT